MFGGRRRGATGEKHAFKKKNNNVNEEVVGLANVEVDGFVKKRKGSTFRGFFGKIGLLLPFLWPRSAPWLQFSAAICFGLLILGRIVNPLVPIVYKLIVNSLTISIMAPEGLSENGTSDALKDENETPLNFRWDYVLIYSALKFVQGAGGVGGGVLGNLRSFLWIPIHQYATREIQIKLFRHIHSLSLRWHLNRKTGEVLRVMDRGTQSINLLLGVIVFQILPTFFDIGVAMVYFAFSFNYWFAVLLFVVMFIYLATTVMVTEWRTKFRREENLLDNETRTKSVDSLLSCETVKYYNAEDFEVNRYREAIRAWQCAEWSTDASMSVLNTSQNVVVSVGLLIGMLLCVGMVAGGNHSLDVGDFVLFVTYLMQLYTPLNFIGSFYRMIAQSFVDMENMFDLLNEDEEVKDVPNAPKLNVAEGKLEFRNVNFHYNIGKPILKNISFIVEPGKTFALVGPSGSGKSTILRLLFRFYDVVDGQVEIDGQNIAEVTQRSLRGHVGVVPQDSVLFNDTIEYNIQYGRIGADKDEVVSAAKAADIHNRIVTFPEGYETLVGERGVKLSGGEKQRVAIARTMLKAPVIVLLDEATAALDTTTERNIQSSLNRICAGRTTLIVAHRLSTIIHADQILVLDEGEIIERGRHSELLEMDSGVYKNMWKLQQMAATRQVSIDNTASDL